MPVLEFAPPCSPNGRRATGRSSARLEQPDEGSSNSTSFTSPRESPKVPKDARPYANENGHAMERDRRGKGEERDDEEAQADVSMDLATTQSQSQSQPGVRLDGRRRDGDLRTQASGSGWTLEVRDEPLDSDDDDDEGRSAASDQEDDEDDLPPLHVEVRLQPTSTVRYDLLRRLLHAHFDEEYETLLTHSEVHDWRDVAVLVQNVERVWIAECPLPTSAVPLSRVSLVFHIYQPPSTSSSTTTFTTSPNADEDGDADVPAASVLELPARSLDGVWDTLIYDGGVKEKLLGYIQATVLFGDANVDFNIVSWNRVVLLHGPPGTGKTSLCRSLAQKLAIRLSDRYDHGKLIEINSHSLFSKWFSESGKLVQRLFGQVTEMVDDESCFVVVLIDEVESLTAARAGAMSGKEPSDALRVVNALLTQLDKLKHRRNCLIMTTSNLSSAIDNAFVDRADIKQYIGLPPTAAVYWILQTCLNEIIRAGLIPHVNLADYKSIELHVSSGGFAPSHNGMGSSEAVEGTRENGYRDVDLPSSSPASSPSRPVLSRQERRDWDCSEKLLRLAEKCQGLSGRTLRRLPVLAHARHISLAHGATTSSGSASRSSRRKVPKLEVWLDAMDKCVDEEASEMDKVDAGGHP
ncbi:hypothetical protein JCM10212_004223 [Sporobolomyces blumeae]